MNTVQVLPFNYTLNFPSCAGSKTLGCMLSWDQVLLVERTTNSFLKERLVDVLGDVDSGGLVGLHVETSLWNEWGISRSNRGGWKEDRFHDRRRNRQRRLQLEGPQGPGTMVTFHYGGHARFQYKPPADAHTQIDSIVRFTFRRELHDFTQVLEKASLRTSDGLETCSFAHINPGLMLEPKDSGGAFKSQTCLPVVRPGQQGNDHPPHTGGGTGTLTHPTTLVDTMGKYGGYAADRLRTSPGLIIAIVGVALSGIMVLGATVFLVSTLCNCGCCRRKEGKSKLMDEKSEKMKHPYPELFDDLEEELANEGVGHTLRVSVVKPYKGEPTKQPSRNLGKDRAARTKNSVRVGKSKKHPRDIWFRRSCASIMSELSIHTPTFQPPGPEGKLQDKNLDKNLKKKINERRKSSFSLGRRASIPKWMLCGPSFQEKEELERGGLSALDVENDSGGFTEPKSFSSLRQDNLPAARHDIKTFDTVMNAALAGGVSGPRRNSLYSVGASSFASGEGTERGEGQAYGATQELNFNSLLDNERDLDTVMDNTVSTDTSRSKSRQTRDSSRHSSMSHEEEEESVVSESGPRQGENRKSVTSCSLVGLHLINEHLMMRDEANPDEGRDKVDCSLPSHGNQTIGTDKTKQLNTCPSEGSTDSEAGLHSTYFA